MPIVDISAKEVVQRKAIAKGKIKLKKETINAIKNNSVKKGNVLEVSKVACVNAVKNTWNLIPYCHQIPIDSVNVEFKIGKEDIECIVEVKANYKTGVEMDALVGVNVALLTIWDMVKYLEKDENGQYLETEIFGVRVERKEKGEKSF